MALAASFGGCFRSDIELRRIIRASKPKNLVASMAASSHELKIGLYARLLSSLPIPERALTESYPSLEMVERDFPFYEGHNGERNGRPLFEGRLNYILGKALPFRALTEETVKREYGV
jgi:hypothetical protein